MESKALENAAAAESALERVKKTATEFQMSGKATDPVEQGKIRALILRDMEAAGVHIPGESAEEGLSLEKSWQVIHYLLTGQIDQAPPPWEMPSWAGKRSVRNETMDEYDS